MVRFEGTLRRGWLVSVFSPLVSVVSVVRCCCCDTDGPWLSLSNTSSSSESKITDGETTEIRSHTEPFQSTNWSLMDPAADSSLPQPRSDKETPADALWPESLKMKDFHCTDVTQENMDYQHGANEE